MCTDVHYGISPNYNDYDSNNGNNDLTLCPFLKYHESNSTALSHLFQLPGVGKGLAIVSPEKLRLSPRSRKRELEFKPREV